MKREGNGKGDKEGGRKGGGERGIERGREGGRGLELERFSHHTHKSVSHVSLHHTNFISLPVPSVDTQVCHIALAVKHQFSITMALLQACTYVQ